MEEGGGDVKHRGKRVERWWWQHGKPKDLKEGVLSVCYIKYELVIMVLASSILVLQLIAPRRELGGKKRRSGGRRRCFCQHGGIEVGRCESKEVSTKKIVNQRRRTLWFVNGS